MTDQEINEAVARKLGWTLRLSSMGGGQYWVCSSCPGSHLTVPNYCHSIEAAWKIVEKMPNGSVGKNIHGNWVCSHGIIGSNKYQIEAADTAPMAICQAFLKLP